MRWGERIFSAKSRLLPEVLGAFFCGDIITPAAKFISVGAVFWGKTGMPTCCFPQRVKNTNDTKIIKNALISHSLNANLQRYL
jgi:hypothetical protein